MSEDNGSKDRSQDSPEMFNPYAPAASEPTSMPSRLPATISVPLAVLLLIFIACGYYYSLGLGIALTVVTLPAYVRAVAKTFRKIDEGKEVTNVDRVIAFVGSLGVVMLCAISGAIGFVFTCFGLLATTKGNGPGNIIILMLCMGFFVSAGIVYWLTWPKRRRP